MNIIEPLASIPFDKAEYSKYKFPDVRYNKSQPQRSEERIFGISGQKNMNAYYRREKTDEQKSMVALYLQCQTANELEEIYQVVSEKHR